MTEFVIANFITKKITHFIFKHNLITFRLMVLLNRPLRQASTKKQLRLHSHQKVLYAFSGNSFIAPCNSLH